MSQTDGGVSFILVIYLQELDGVFHLEQFPFCSSDFGIQPKTEKRCSVSGKSDFDGENRRTCGSDSRGDLIALSIDLPPQLLALLFQLVDLHHSSVVFLLNVRLRNMEQRMIDTRFRERL